MVLIDDLIATGLYTSRPFVINHDVFVGSSSLAGLLDPKLDFESFQHQHVTGVSASTSSTGSLATEVGCVEQGPAVSIV